MVTWEQARSWKPSDIHRVAAQLAASARTVDALTDRLGVLLPVDWNGPAAAEAGLRVDEVRAGAMQRRDVLTRIERCITDTAIAMSPLCARIRDAEDTASGNDFTVDTDGHVHDRVQEMASASAEMWEIVRDRRRIHSELEDTITELIRAATELDDNAARVLGRADEDIELRVLPAAAPTDGSPAANAAYWQSLSQSAKTTLLVTSPQLIGNMDGIPAQVRDQANRRVLTTERTRLVAQEQALARELDDNALGGWLSNADAGLEQTRRRLRSIDELTETLNQGDRQLLVFDNSAYEETMAAVAVGNVDTATHVAVFVPGLSSTVQDDVQRYDGDMESLKAVVEQSLSSDDESVACVTWMDYQAPQLGWGLVDPDRTVGAVGAADAGAPRLAQFLDGLDAMRSTDPHLSLLGHSYGSLTAATALRTDTGVDDFVAMGSPGLGVSEVSTLAVPAGHTFIAEAADDVVADFGAFGVDPSMLPGVSMLPTGEDGTHDASRGHSGYLAAGTVGQESTAAVVAGRPPGR